jgi:hypothetical protein
MGRGKVKSFRPQGKDKAPAAASKKAKKAGGSGISHGRVESAKTERKVSPHYFGSTNLQRVKRIEHV